MSTAPRPRPERPDLAVIVPVFNEEAALAPFLARAEPVLAGLELPWTWFFVNDGSRDGTLEALRAAQASRPNLRIVNLARNFGKEAALTAGFDLADADIYVTLDVDLQDPPDLIPQFLARWREGFDTVYGVRASRLADGPVKRTSANLFYRLFNRISPLPIPENAGDYRLLDRRVVDELRRLRERNRFMKALFVWPGFTATAVPFVREERVAGRSTWSFWRLWNFALDGILSFSTAPLRVWTYVGFSIAAVSFLFVLYVLLTTFLFGRDIPGLATLVSLIGFLGGIQLISIGLLGEYIGRIFLEVKQRPIYVVESLQ